MKSKRLLTVVASLLLLNGTVFGHSSYTGYSGAPGSNGRCASSCHGNPGGTIQISGFPSEYIPEQTYAIAISHSGGSSIRQFNGSCRIGSGSQNAGVITSGTNTATYNTSGETNGIHLSSTNRDNGTFSWTAPVSGTGEVRLYIAGLQGGESGQNSQLQLVSFEQATGIVEDEPHGIRSDFSLKMNYPNPFNASTTISYSLPVPYDVTIDIFNIVGQRVATLHEGMQPAGQRTAVWNASNQPSGVYFARLQSDERTASIKMVLLR